MAQGGLREAGKKQLSGPHWLFSDLLQRERRAGADRPIYRLSTEESPGFGGSLSLKAEMKACCRKGRMGQQLFPRSREGGEGRKKDRVGGISRLGSGFYVLQGSEVGRPCGHQPRDTVTLLSCSVVPAADMPFSLSR